MIIQKIDKKKLYINISVLVIIFGLIGYLLLSSFVFNGSKDEDVIIVGEVAEVEIDAKYKDFKKINLDIFEDNRYGVLREPIIGLRLELEKGNPKPFEKE
jgi:flagellar basal body-associated protein FliL